MIKKLIIAIALLLVGAVASRAANPVAAMLDRIAPGASKHFIVELQPGATDFFELDQKGDKVVVRGNTYVNIATGVNWYLKYYANVHVSWNSPQAALPQPLPRVPQKERHETDLKVRYNFNYCTYSYTMAFWDWERWEQEIDWMALHGVNAPLAAVGMECAWRNMLLRLGYTDVEVNAFIAGPAFLAWWAMNNIEGWGGPNPPAWYQRQEALQKKILARMRQWGMQPVLPGYSGMMPSNAAEKLGIGLAEPAQTWNKFTRPAFLQPTDPKFQEIAAIYYDELTRLYGKADYYSMDPFHELSNGAGLDFAASGQAVLQAMKAVNPQATWVVQAWNENPRPAMIDGLETGDLLILDLFAECSPMWGIPSRWQRQQGFGNHNWAMCLLENFGGNVGLHGRLDQLLNNFYASKGHPLASHLSGIGFTMEGSENNPVMFELMSELPWRPEPITKEEWLPQYLCARYGGDPDPRVLQAWQLLANGIYNCPPGNYQQGTHESIFCARPTLDNFQASKWSRMENYYDPMSTLRAAQLMCEAADAYRGNNNFEYDLVDITRQAIADQGRLAYQHAMADYKAFNREGFEANSALFMRLLDAQDQLLASRSEFRVGRWLDFAKRAADTPADQKLYEWNARVQITTWGAKENAEAGLRDYAHKEWNGLLSDFYRPRWEAFFAGLQAHLSADNAHEARPKAIDYYEMEEPWTLMQNPYPVQAEGDPVDAAKAAISQCPAAR